MLKSEPKYRICIRRPFFVLKDENGKYFVEADSLHRYINTCPNFNPYEIPGVYEPDNMDTSHNEISACCVLTNAVFPLDKPPAISYNKR